MAIDRQAIISYNSSRETIRGKRGEQHEKSPSYQWDSFIPVLPGSFSGICVYSTPAGCISRLFRRPAATTGPGKTIAGNRHLTGRAAIGSPFFYSPYRTNAAQKNGWAYSACACFIMPAFARRNASSGGNRSAMRNR